MPAVQVLDKSPIAGDMGVWPKLKLTPQHDKLWAETKAAMLWAASAFADIWLSMMVDKDHEQAWFTDRIDTCATDDKFLYVNPDWYFKLNLDERIFVACHEIMHAMFGHAGMGYLLNKAGEIRYPDGLILKYDDELMNSAMDYVINDQLVVGKMGVMPDEGLHWPEFISGEEGVLDAYRKLYQQQGGGSGGKRTSKSNKGNRQVGPPGSGKPFDKLLEPGTGRGKTPAKAISERSQSEWDTTITAAMEAAKVRGQLPSNLERMFTKRLQPKADWRDLYQLAVSKKLGNDRYTWATLDMQLAYRRIGSPGRTSYGCDLVVVAVDTSGSIGQATLDVFLAETMGLLEQVKPKRVVFVQCDAIIHEWDECDACEDLYGRKLKGGGGSRTEPVFERVQAEGLEPDLLVYLTDLFVSFPTAKPFYPVIWGVVDNANGQAPWGEIVHVPQQIAA